MNFRSYLWPQIIFSTTSSDFNKKIEVRKSLGKLSLRVNNITQSGGIVDNIYKKIYLPPGDRKKVLILGFGAGSFAKLISKKYPLSTIVGVEIDPKIIQIAKKFFEINELRKLKTVCTDGMEYMRNNRKIFDLIFVDLYFGEKINREVGNRFFLNSLKKSLEKEGEVIFNLINFKKYQSQNENFLQKLRLIFSSVTTKKVYSNLIVYASSL